MSRVAFHPPDAGVSDSGVSDSGGSDSGVSDSGPAGATLPPGCVDADGDGFPTCLEGSYPGCCASPQSPTWQLPQDCDDDRWSAQPGGHEFPNNGLDDDCDGTSDEVAPSCGCDLEGPVSADDLAAAIGLCDSVVTQVSRTGEPGQFGVYGDYFTDITASSGGCFALMSTGAAGSEQITFGGEAYCTGCAGLNTSCFPDPDPAGGGEGVCDLATLELTLRPPSNARGFAFRFMFVTAEWPEFVCHKFNDTFYAIVQASGMNGGAPQNVSFDAAQREITVSAAFLELPSAWSTPLSNTPFGQPDYGSSCSSSPEEGCELPGYCADAAADLDREGSGTGWLVTSVALPPGEEELQLTFTIHDEGDAIYDSLVIIDDFYWVSDATPLVTLPM